MNPDYPKSAALVGLTAQYTDSEGSAEESDNEGQPDEGSTSRDSTPNLFAVSSLERKNMAGLVSYSTNEGADDEIEKDVEMVEIEEEESQDKSPEKRKADAERRRPISPITFHRSLQLIDNPDDIKLPSEYSGRCSNALQEKITRYYEKKTKEGKNMNDSIQKMKDFRNPSIYEKLIAYCGIDEMGTNYPPEYYDPHSWGPESLYDELAKRQKEEMDKKEKERKEKTKVEFISGTAKKTNPESSAIDLAMKRRSKWDQAIPIKPATLIAASVLPITSATGTKPTVISAFGTISKKKQ